MRTVLDPVADLEREVGLMLRRARAAGESGDRGEIEKARAAARELRERASEVLAERMAGSRPELRSRGGDASAGPVRSAMHEARERLERSQTRCSACPAAQMLGDDAVHCAVERNVIAARTDPMTLLSFCLGEYRSCPSWKAEKERIAAGRKPLVSVAEGV